jgi:hypothetical protein
VKHYVFSTATTPVSFVEYSPHVANRVPTVKRKVIIKGGANRPTKHLLTPRGIATEVSAEDMDFLSKDVKFQKMVKEGFMTFASDEREIDRVVSDMKAKDNSAPGVAADFVKGGRFAKDLTGGGTITAGAPATA